MRARITTALLGLVVVVTGCVIGEESTRDSNRPPADDPHGLVPGSGPYRDLIAQVLVENASQPMPAEAIDFHREVFADGEVTFAEYERSYFAIADCVREHGFVPIGPGVYRDGPMMSLHIGIDPRKRISLAVESVPGSDEAAVNCQATWGKRVESVWLRQNEPTEEEIQGWIDAALDCAREKGIAVPDPAPPTVYLEAIHAGCEPWAVVWPG